MKTLAHFCPLGDQISALASITPPLDLLALLDLRRMGPLQGDCLSRPLFCRRCMKRAC
jgi:hypothetical protein